MMRSFDGSNLVLVYPIEAVGGHASKKKKMLEEKDKKKKLEKQ